MNLGCADGREDDTLLLLHLVATESLGVEVRVTESKVGRGIDLACKLEPGEPKPLGKVMAPLSIKEAIDDRSTKLRRGKKKLIYHQFSANQKHKRE
jgi:hypothetical protein